MPLAPSSRPARSLSVMPDPTAMPRRPKVLISAFACNPERGSEPGVGHFFVRELARYCDLTVITEELQNRPAIERLQSVDELYRSISFHFIPWPLVDAQGRRIDDLRPLAYYRQLRIWEQRAYALAADLARTQIFDLTHHLTMQGYREPGYLWRLPIPFIWGPAGGHAPMPWRYFGLLGWRGCIQHGFRNIANALQARFHMRVRHAAKAARAVVVNTTAERDAFRRLYAVEPLVIPEFGAESVPPAPRRRPPGQPLKIVWSGVHIPRKALPILLHSASLLGADTPYEIHILGNGVETPRWQALAERLGINARCRWHGRLPRHEALRVMSRCDVFALTSLVDGTSCVLNEAISLGLPAVCHNCCGFADLVDEHCGILVPLSTPSGSSRLFADAIRRLANDADLYNRLSDGVMSRAGLLQQAIRGHQLWQVYQDVLDLPVDQPTQEAAA